MDANTQAMPIAKAVEILASSNTDEIQKRRAESALLNRVVAYVGKGFDYLHDEEMVEQAFHDAFSDFCKNLRNSKFEGRNGAAVTTYFVSIYKRKCLNYVLKKVEIMPESSVETKEKPDFYSQFTAKYITPYDKFYDALAEKYWEEAELYRTDWTENTVRRIKAWQRFRKVAPLYADMLSKKYFQNWSNQDFVNQHLYPDKNTAASSLSQALATLLRHFKN